MTSSGRDLIQQLAHVWPIEDAKRPAACLIAAAGGCLWRCEEP